MTWQDLLTALGLVAVIEGLVLALAPLRLEEMLKALSEMPESYRRGFGLSAVTLGVLLIWVARGT